MASFSPIQETVESTILAPIDTDLASLNEVAASENALSASIMSLDSCTTRVESEVESGYVSSTSDYENSKTKAVPATAPFMSPVEVLRFVKILFPNVYQSTAFGLTGLVTIDMLSKIQKDWPESPKVDLIFLDTLYHFQETYDLVNRVQEQYPELKVHVFKPYGAESTQEFEDIYGEKLYDRESELYDVTAKVEPLQRAYTELGVKAILTGRRRSQGGGRQKIPVIELDEENNIIKINPLVTWSFSQVHQYIKENNVPYNALLDQGYKSIGDWHSTSPVGEGEDERAGRWKGQAKTECGIHNKKSRYAQYLEEMERNTSQPVLA
ncbi:unnamed protein product [Parascedosporium putredinis]|uniref:Phosphoadenosine phosphosulphate reductase domain-containing protein n=1 Tax=Parascedosporium putredinis TaxID=1442378 RepID=A0A9P1GW57_9PEZI|nr:unnamed protein product [Parascedosporium putredinis]CAI7988471.1 unnamed protein product [Parascedosporium putredinis]